VTVPLPSAVAWLAVRITVTFKAALAGNCTGLEGEKLTVIPGGEVLLRVTGSPLVAREW